MTDKLYTMEEAKQLLREQWEQGVECPCCKQFVKLYPYKINALAVSDLIRLWHLIEGVSGEYAHVSHFSKDRGGTFAKLAHWGLIESQINEDTTKRTSGMWTITALGRKFVEDEVTVPRRAYLFNKKCYGMSRDQVTVRDALGDKFDYEELMST